VLVIATTTQSACELKLQHPARVGSVLDRPLLSLSLEKKKIYTDNARMLNLGWIVFETSKNRDLFLYKDSFDKAKPGFNLANSIHIS
jgi:hypothetical protein